MPPLAKLNPWIFALGLCAAGPLFLGSCRQAPSPEAEAASPAKAAGIRILVLEGSPYDRGLTHGRTLKKEIHEVVNLWKADMAKKYNTDADPLIRKFFAATDYVQATRKWAPSILEEIQGMADGCGLDFQTMFVFQLVDETWFYMKDVAEHCSGIGAGKQAGHPGYVAQNMDLETFRNGYQVLLHIKHPGTGLESYVFSCAGLVALNGLNSASIGVCVNTIAQLNSCLDGLPVAFVIRGLLERTTAEDAIAFLTGVKHASGQNYLIGGPERVYDFEASANKVVPFLPSEGGRIVYHTNHPLANDDFNAEYLATLRESGEDKIRSGNSYVRYQALQKRLASAAGPLTADLIVSILRSKDSDLHPVCRNIGPNATSFTFGTAVMELSEPPKLYLAPGPPDITPFSVHLFQRESSQE